MRFTAVGRTLVFVLVAFLAACGSGGGANPPSTSVSTHSLTFSAASPDDATPPAQTVNATFTGDTVLISVLNSGPAVGTVTFTRSGNTAQVTVTPASPSGVGAGVFSGVVTVAGYACANPDCSQQVKGNTESIAVTYSIPPIVRVVAPYVGTTNVAADVVIRGRGFKQFAVQGVTFGATPASAFTVVSDTEIDASYPALAAGSYAVQISAPTSPGAMVSNANLVVVDAPNFSPTTVSYPSTPVQLGRLIYDAERRALLLAQPGGDLLRYSFSGAAWTTSAMTGLADIALTTDGRQLLTLSQTAMMHLDPATLATNVTTPAPSLTSPGVFKNLVVPNDDNAIVTTGRSDNHASARYTYLVRAPEFKLSTTNLVDATPGMSANGALAMVVQGDPSQTGSAAVEQYRASLGTFSTTGIGLNQNSIPPALDRVATRIVLNGRNVYDGSFKLLGTLPSTTLAVVVKPDATRAYTFDSTTPEVRSFDLTTGANGGALPEVGSPTPVSDPGTGVAMAISPDGGNVFLAGSAQVVVLTTPP